MYVCVIVTMLSYILLIQSYEDFNVPMCLAGVRVCFDKSIAFKTVVFGWVTSLHLMLAVQTHICLLLGS